MEPNRTLLGCLRIWIMRHSTILGIGLGTIAGLTFLYNDDRRSLATSLSILSLGSVYLYWKNAARGELRSDQVVIITGCDSGLGYSLALHCRSLGATVIAGVFQPHGPGAENLHQNGINTLHLDLTNDKSVEKFGCDARSLIAKNNLTFINNAGVMIFGEFEWQTDQQTRSQFEVNVLGTMKITKEFMPMIRNAQARLIIVSSHCARAPLPGNAAYGATKAALAAWATSLRVELGKFGVNVVCFVPGSFTKDSNLLSRQNENFEAMASAMTREARTFYGNYFTRYRQYLCGLSREIYPHKLVNPVLYEIFEGALLDVHPKATYTCEPWRYTIYHNLFRITPTPWRDYLVQKFIMMPEWRSNSENAPVCLESNSEEFSNIEAGGDRVLKDPFPNS